MPALDKPDSQLTTDDRQMALSLGPSRGPQIRRVAAALTAVRYSCSVEQFIGWLLVGADDLGRGLLPRSGPDHAARATS